MSRQSTVARPELELVVSAFAEVTRPMMLETMSVTSCVAATRIALDVLSAFAIPAKPLPVWLRATVALPDLPAGPNAATSSDSYRPRRYVVDAGDPDDPNPGAGHVVVGVPASRWWCGQLIDLSADQVSRPEHGMVVPSPIVAEVPSEFFTEPGCAVSAVNDAGVQLIYTRVRARAYTKSPNWTRRTLSGDSTMFARVTTATIVWVRQHTPEASR